MKYGHHLMVTKHNHLYTTFKISPHLTFHYTRHDSQLYQLISKETIGLLICTPIIVFVSTNTVISFNQRTILSVSNYTSKYICQLTPELPNQHDVYHIKKCTLNSIEHWSINTPTLSILIQTMYSTITLLLLKYINLNIIVMGDLQYTVISHNLPYELTPISTSI